MCVCVRERERESVCVCERERETRELMQRTVDICGGRCGYCG